MKNKKLNDKGFYIALCSCIAIISVIAYVGNNTSPQKELKASDTVEVVDTDTLRPQKTLPPATPKPIKNTTISPTPSPKKAETSKPAASKNISVQTPAPTPAPTFDSNFIQPLAGDILTTFSDGALMYNKDLDDWRSHDGIDIKAKLGSEVKAVYSGVVSEITNDIHGKTVKIDHQNGYVSVYSNLDTEVNTKVGDNINQGDIIGKVGNTSICEQFMEPHLHFELIENGKYVNPNKYLN